VRTLSFHQLAIKIAGSVEDFYTPDHLRTLIRNAGFPAPIKFSEAKNAEPFWIEAEVDDHLASLAAKRPRQRVTAVTDGATGTEAPKTSAARNRRQKRRSDAAAETPEL